MLLFESDNGNKKVCIWKDEMPFNYMGNSTLHMQTEAGDINWNDLFRGKITFSSC